MKNREERPANLDRGATQQVFDFGDEAEPTLPANFLRPEATDPAFADTPSLSVSPDADLMTQVVDPRNLEQAWRRVKRNRGAPGPDGMTIREFESWCPEHWPAIQQQLLDGTYRPAPVRRKTIPKDGGGERLLGIPNVLDRFIQQAIAQVLTPIFDPDFSATNAARRCPVSVFAPADPLMEPPSGSSRSSDNDTLIASMWTCRSFSTGDQRCASVPGMTC